MSHIYAPKKRSSTPAPAAKRAESISKSDMLHLSGAGAPQPMSPALREKFEPGFNADLSNIRISRGHIPEEMGVQAVAKGTDILLDSRAGMDVLGHELAHVVQQAQGRVQGGFPVVENAALEHEADVMGARVAAGKSAMEGGMPGFSGGEMMSIAPMSDASAPAQCKSLKEKKEEKAAEEARQQKQATIAQEKAHAKAFGEKMRAHVNAGSAGVTSNTPLGDLISGNRLNYMRDNDSKDMEKANIRKDLAAATGNVTAQYTDYLKNAAKADDVYDYTDGGLSSGKAVDFALEEDDPERKAKALAIRQREDEIAHTDLQAFLQMLEGDEDAMRNLKLQTDEVYRPMGDFNAETNKGGIVGGADNAGLYALNDMYLRSIAPRAAGESRNIKRSQITMGMMNRLLNRTANPEELTESESRTNDMFNDFMLRTGIKRGADRAIEPKAGQQYVTQADLPQSGADWSHSGSWKVMPTNGYNMEAPRIDMMPGGSKDFGAAPAAAAAPKKKGLFKRLFGG